MRTMKITGCLHHHKHANAKKQVNLLSQCVDQSPGAEVSESSNSECHKNFWRTSDSKNPAFVFDASTVRLVEEKK